MRKINLLILVVWVSSTLYSQQGDTLHIGTRITTLQTTAETGKYVIYWDLPDGKYKPVAIETRSIELLTVNNKATWAYIQKYQTEKGVDVDTTFFDENTLLPIAYRTDIVSAGYKEVVDFEANILKTKIIYADSVKYNEKNIPLTYLNAPMEDYIISRLPLTQNYTTVFRSINTGKNHFESYDRITVTGSEEMELPNHQKTDCWIIEVNNGFNKLLLWFSKKDHLFMKSKFSSAKRGMFWKIRLLN